MLRRTVLRSSTATESAGRRRSHSRATGQPHDAGAHDDEVMPGANHAVPSVLSWRRRLDSAIACRNGIAPFLDRAAEFLLQFGVLLHEVGQFVTRDVAPS